MSFHKAVDCKFRLRFPLRCFALAVVLLSASVCSAGTIYTVEMANNEVKTLFEVWAKDTKAKFSVIDSSDPNTLSGTTFIILDSGSRWLWSFPHEAAYHESVQAHVKEDEQKLYSLLNVEIKDSSQKELVVDQDGGKIAGIETRYYEIRTRIVTFEGGQARNILATQKLWIAPSLANLAPSLDILTFNFTDSAILNELVAPKKLHGYPLKSISTLATNGKVTQTRMVEVKALLSNKEIPDSVFEMPANYVRKDLPAPHE